MTSEMENAQASDRVNSAFEKKAVFSMNADELAGLLSDLCAVKHLDEHNMMRIGSRAQTVQHLLLVRHMQEMDKNAGKVAKTALWVSIAAFIMSMLQVLATFGIINPLCH